MNLNALLEVLNNEVKLNKEEYGFSCSMKENEDCIHSSPFGMGINEMDAIIDYIKIILKYEFKVVENVLIKKHIDDKRIENYSI